ncbi:MAG: hypothetical protein ABJK25_00020 [Halieaceae bacterium]
MTEGEAIQAAQATWANVITMSTVEITLLSGYIIVAYLAGKELERSQVVIVNTLYLLLSLFVLSGIYTLARRATELAELSIDLSEYRELGPQIWLPYGVVVIFVFCIAASMKFMWDIRHRKDE